MESHPIKSTAFGKPWIHHHRQALYCLKQERRQVAAPWSQDQRCWKHWAPLEEFVPRGESKDALRVPVPSSLKWSWELSRCNKPKCCETESKDFGWADFFPKGPRSPYLDLNDLNWLHQEIGKQTPLVVLKF